MLVMKFGGTSVGDAKAITRLIDIVKSRLPKKPVVVVSAISKATNILQDVALAAGKNNIDYALTETENLKLRHLQILNELIPDNSLRAEGAKKIDQYFLELTNLLKGVSLLGELSNRSQAKIISFGELLSSNIVSLAMQQNNLANAWLDARQFMITNDDYLKAKPDLGAISQKVPAIMQPYLAKNLVVLTQGFIGNSHNGIATVLGRESSDYSATLIGMALNVEEIEIWTDVDGILTADPRKVEGTKLVPTISFAEAAELASFGAKVLHPLTIQPAIEKNIPVRILNSMHKENPGTLILPQTSDEDIRSIACKKMVTVLNVVANNPQNSYTFLKKIFETLDKHDTTLDIANISRTNVSLILNYNEEYLPKIIEELSKFATVNIEHNKSLICVVGKNIKQDKGIVNRIFQVLENFVITMISHGASDINLSFVVNRDELEQAMQKLHDEFFNDSKS
jgi:aspartate kinase